MELSVSVSAVPVLGCIDTGVVLVALQMAPVLDKFVGLELMGCNQVAILTTGIRDTPVVEEELIGRWCWINA